MMDPGLGIIAWRSRWIQVESEKPCFAGTNMERNSSNDGEGRKEKAAEAAAEKAKATEQAGGGSRR